MNYNTNFQKEAGKCLDMIWLSEAVLWSIRLPACAKADIGIRGEKIAAIAEAISPSEAGQVVDATNRYVFPGAIDSHYHVGIYRPFREDAMSESTSSASGGVTTILTYFRTGQSYLNKMGPYKEILPELLDLSKDSFLVDYGYHLALFTDQHISEIEWLVRDGGVSTFKYYMFYKLLNLSRPSPGPEVPMIGTGDLVYKFMRK
jgi:dihydropyrimidinase/allantoinase